MLEVLVAPSEKTQRGSTGSYRVLPKRDGNTLFSGVLEVKDTQKGPRPARFRIKRDDDEEIREPREFVELARMSDNIYVPDDAEPGIVGEIRELLSAYELELREVEVCRLCLLEEGFTKLRNGINYGGGGSREQICLSCAKQELRRLTSWRDIDRDTLNHLEELLEDVGDVEKLIDLLDASLDPEVTKYDEISSNITDQDEIDVDELPVDNDLKDVLSFDSLLPVQVRAVQEGLLKGNDLAIVSATATGKTLVGELAGIQNVLDGEGKALFLVPLVALANQKYDEFREAYSGLVDVSLRVGSNRIYGGGERYDPGADVVVGTYEGVDHVLRSGNDLGEVGTVVIDEVHNIYDEERGHRVDGLITRLKQQAGDAQWIYLSATVGGSQSARSGSRCSIGGV